MRRLPPHGKEKCGSPRVTLRLHQLKEKKKDKLSISGDHDTYNCRGMDTVNKNGGGVGDDNASNKEPAGTENDENTTSGNNNDHKESGLSASSNGGSTNNNPSSDNDHHHSDRSDTSMVSGAPVKRTHSTDEDEDTKKKRRKDDGNKGKSGSNSGGSPKSLIGVESEGEEAKSVESPGPKVPPLKIVIAGPSLEETGNGGRNGKNGSGRHHLPYVVSTTTTTATNSTSSGGVATGNSNSNLLSAPNSDTASSNVGTTESQSGNTEESLGPRSPADEPVTSPSGNGASSAGGRAHQRVLRSHRSGAAGKDDRTSGSGGSNNGSPVGLTTEGGSPKLLEGGSPKPSGEQPSNPVGTSTGEAGGNTEEKPGIAASSVSGNTSSTSVGDIKVNTNISANVEETPSTNAGNNAPPNGQTPPTPAIQQTPSTLTHQTDVHPRKRKMRPKESAGNGNNNSSTNNITNNNSTGVIAGGVSSSPVETVSVTTSASPNSGPVASPPNNTGTGNGASCTAPNATQNGSNTAGGQLQETNVGVEAAGPSSTPLHHDQSVTNSYQLFLNIRKQIERKRKGLFPVQPKPPQGFKDYLMNRCTYVLASNASNRVPPPNTSPPANLHHSIKDLYIAQEKERHRLLMQHVIEKEKLVLSVEQEILRVHGRAARALANQALPFSACTILRDEEVYSAISPEQEEKDRNQARSRYNGRLFLSWLQDVDDKWEKIKESMLVRHHNEAESLHAVQKMDWEWKMKELGICEFKSNPVIDESHVPMVHVSDDFDLLPA